MSLQTCMTKWSFLINLNAISHIISENKGSWADQSAKTAYTSQWTVFTSYKQRQASDRQILPQRITEQKLSTKNTIVMFIYYSSRLKPLQLIRGAFPKSIVSQLWFHRYQHSSTIQCFPKHSSNECSQSVSHLHGLNDSSPPVVRNRVFLLVRYMGLNKYALGRNKRANM